MTFASDIFRDRSDDIPPMQTPWGRATWDDAHLFGGRVRHVITEGHGGLQLQPSAMKLLPDAFLVDLSNWGWAEEDVEMPIALALLWRHFSEEDKEHFGGESMILKDSFWKHVFNYSGEGRNYAGAREALEEAYKNLNPTAA